jgi:uncharacterized protein YcsI (UPF0317 family)
MTDKLLNPAELRARIRAGQFDLPTAGVAADYVQANLVILPAEAAFDFLLFCQRNPKPCPLIEVLEAGRCEPATAPGADLRIDLSRYRIWRKGELAAEVSDIKALWRDDLVSFLLGCSFSFEAALLKAHIPVRHIECACNVPMFRTNRLCNPAGRFSGPLVVSMRPIPAAMVPATIELCSHFPHVHGAPVQVGDPGALGIADLGKPDYGDAVPIQRGELPVFWACGVTPQAIAMASRPEFCITHSPGRMFVTDVLNDDYLAGRTSAAGPR